MRRLLAAAALLLAGCSSGPDSPSPPDVRYRDAWNSFRAESDAMLRFAGRNRLHVQGSAGRARAALDAMRDLLGADPARRLGALADRFEALSRTIAADNGLSGGQELAVGAIRDEVARDFAPDRVELAAVAAPPKPAPPAAFERWEAAHRAFAASAQGDDAARIVQDYSEVREAMEGLATGDEDRIRAERFLREYERIAGLVEDGKAVEQDLKGLPVLEADIRASFGDRK